ncbi:hypothetical protein [Vibrio diabolicus]|uniref:hypothetical protein n=1 Tax=Vibrio diabolicus TaxID=50719 RepID=UPI003D7D1372
MSQPIPTSYNQIIAHTIEQALALSVNAKNENAIAGFCQLQGPTGGAKVVLFIVVQTGKFQRALNL